MKVRNGFVSNSSSSSFVVAVDKNAGSKIKLNLEIDLKDYMRWGKKIKTIKELDSYYVEEYDFDPSDYDDAGRKWHLDDYLRSKNAIENGKVIFVGSFSDEAGGVEAMLCREGLEGIVDEDVVEVIESRGGY